MSAAPQLRIPLEMASPTNHGGSSPAFVASGGWRRGRCCSDILPVAVLPARDRVANYFSRLTIRLTKTGACPIVRRWRFISAAPSEWSHAFFFAYPMTMVYLQARKFTEDRSIRTFVHLLSYGHLFTTEPGAPPFFLMGSEGLGRDFFRASSTVHASRCSSDSSASRSASASASR